MTHTWCNSPPTAEEVAEHAKAHPLPDGFGGLWIRSGVETTFERLNVVGGRVCVWSEVDCIWHHVGGPVGPKWLPVRPDGTPAEPPEARPGEVPAWFASLPRETQMAEPLLLALAQQGLSADKALPFIAKALRETRAKLVTRWLIEPLPPIPITAVPEVSKALDALERAVFEDDRRAALDAAGELLRATGRLP